MSKRMLLAGLLAAAVTVFAIPEIALAGEPRLQKSVRNLESDTSYSQSTTANQGDRIQYRIRYSAPGPGHPDAINVTVTDPLPAHSTFVFCRIKGKAKGEDCEFDGTTITWHLGDVPAGSSQVLLFRTKINANAPAGVIPNVATANADNHDQIDSNEATVVIERVRGQEGCTPGYWKNHTDRWLGAAPSDDFDATFGVEVFDPNVTLAQAVGLGGGGTQALARHAVAALLNAHGGVPNDDGSSVDYPYTVVQVIGMVQDAIAGGTVEATKDQLAAANELGCPLSGTNATGG